LALLAQVFIITTENPFKISQRRMDFLIMKLQVFMKIKKATSGSVFLEEQAVTMGNSFRNYIIDGNDMSEDWTGKTFPNRRPYEVTSIIEDKTGNFWFVTRGNTFVYDGKAFTNFTNNGKPFKNVRSIIQDNNGNIWLGGADGLWRYDGRTFTNFTQKFVGYIIEDKKGNIWTSSESSNDLTKTLPGYNANNPLWALSRYDERSLSDKKSTVTEITNKPIVFGILEANDGSIWFGDFDGVHRYDGKTITDFKGKGGQK
jgi:hypothetical protein